MGRWIEGQADRAEGQRILAELPRLSRGEGWVWAPGDDVLARVAFPLIRTFDSSRTPQRAERTATPRTLAEVDLSAITTALSGMDVPAAGRRVDPAPDGLARLSDLDQRLQGSGRR